MTYRFGPNNSESDSPILKFDWLVEPPRVVDDYPVRGSFADFERYGVSILRRSLHPLVEDTMERLFPRDTTVQLIMAAELCRAGAGLFMHDLFSLGCDLLVTDRLKDATIGLDQKRHMLGWVYGRETVIAIPQIRLATRSGPRRLHYLIRYTKGRRVRWLYLIIEEGQPIVDPEDPRLPFTNERLDRLTYAASDILAPYFFARLLQDLRTRFVTPHVW